MISTHTFGLIELVGTFGLILGVLVWQLISIRRTLRRDRETEERRPDDR